MPSINDLLAKSKGKFKKSSYRPWNYMDEMDKEQQDISVINGEQQSDNAAKTAIKKVSNGNQKEIKRESIKPLHNINYELNEAINNIEKPELVINEELKGHQTAIKQRSNGNSTDAAGVPNLVKNVVKQFDINITKEDKKILNKVTENKQDIISKVQPNLKQKSSVIKNFEEKGFSGESANTLDFLFQLSGHQKTIFMFMVERCLSRGQLSTGPIHRSTLVKVAGTSFKMVKTTYHRLEEKKLIFRENGKTGRGGYCKFRISEVIREAALTYKTMVERGIKEESNGNQTDIKQHPNGSQTGINRESDISNAGGKDFQSLPTEWQLINIEDSLKILGFTEKHLIQLYFEGKQNPQIVQDSINQFAFGLQNGDAKKYKDNAQNVLMGVLLKPGGSWTEKNYKSPQEVALVQFLEKKKTEQERIKKLEEEVLQYEFGEWLLKINDSQRNEIVGEISQSAMFSERTLEHVARGRLREYFIKHIKNSEVKSQS